MSSTADLGELARDRHVADLGHARVTARSGVLQDEHGVLVDVQIRVLDRLVVVLDAAEHQRLTPVAESRSEAADCLMTAPSGARFPFSTRSPRHCPADLRPAGSPRRSGFPEQHRVGRLDPLGVRDVLADRLAGDRDRLGLEQRQDLLSSPRADRRVVEVLHQVLARRLQVDQPRYAAGPLVDVVQGQFDPDAAGDRQQLDDEVRRAADRRVRPDRVREGVRVRMSLGLRSSFTISTMR